jgi:hypothetical protein
MLCFLPAVENQLLREQAAGARGGLAPCVRLRRRHRLVDGLHNHS